MYIHVYQHMFKPLLSDVYRKSCLLTSECARSLKLIVKTGYPKFNQQNSHIYTKFFKENSAFDTSNIITNTRRTKIY